MTVRTAAEGNTFIATYGSLRRDMQNFRVNGSGGGKFVGLGKTVDNVNLYRYGGAYFPSVSLAHGSNGTPVVVDIFEAPIKGGLEGPYDTLEGYPHFYNRSEVEIKLESGETLTAWIYHIDEDQRELVESGDWCLYNRPSYYEELQDSSN